MNSLASNPSIQTPKGTPEFVRLDSKHHCQVCKGVARDAMQTSCGHRICQNCIEPFFKDATGPVLCPAGEDDCEMQEREHITPDPSGRREVRNLQVYCDFKGDGCKLKLKWKDLENHVKDCEYQLVPCQNSGCEMNIPKVRQKHHQKEECEFRLEPCRHCQIYVPAALMERHIQQECLNVQLTCPYSCSTQVYQREELNNHKEFCPNKPTVCKFKSVGCTYEGRGEDVAQHLLNDMNHHLELVTLFAARAEMQSLELRTELQTVKSERDSFQAQVVKLSKEVEVLKSNMEKQIKSNREMTLKMVSLTERVIHLEKQTETYAKKDQVERHDRDVRTMQTSLTQVRAQVVQLERAGSSENRGASAEPSDTRELKRKLDTHDTQIGQFDVQLAELDMRFQILETASYDGTLMWKVRDYSRRKLEAVQGKTLSLYSQPFYTHRYGYKMCARVYLNGDGMGKGSHMSLFFVVMRGEYDNLLQWPFQAKVSMTLLDQDNNQTNLSDTFRPDPTSSSFKKPTTDMNIASGCPLFVSHAILETPKYVKDDIVILKFEVDSTNIRHP